MKPSAAGGRLVESPGGPFLPRDWLTLLVICLLAVVIRASVMRFLPSILHPDEQMWLDEANRLVNHQGLVTWDFQVGERSWLWPGLMAAFMYLGELFGSPPNASLGGVSALICIISLGPVICGFLWGRNVAGFAGAVTTGVLNAVWFELVYFYAHPLSESAAGAALVVGLYLVYPGRNVWSDRHMFIGAVMMGLAAVLRPQLIPAIALIVVAVGGRPAPRALSGAHRGDCAADRAERTARLGYLGMAVSRYDYVCILPDEGLLRRRPEPVLFVCRLGGGRLGLFRRVDRAVRALWRIAATAAVLGRRDYLRGPFRFQSQGISVYLARPAAHHDACRRRVDDGGRVAGAQVGPTGDPARAVGRRAAGLDLRLPRSGGVAEPYMVLDSIPRVDPCDASHQCGQGCLRGRNFSRQYVVARCGLLRFAPRHPTLQHGRYSRSNSAERL
jgi:hypothetical protein